MSASRSALGDRWLDVYLTSPIWRFTAVGGTCGAAPVIGLLVPSVDRVGRYFPLTIVSELPAHVTPFDAATGASQFFDRAEQLAIETLEAEYVDFESFDERLIRLADDLAVFSIPPAIVLQEGASAVLTEQQEGQWHVPIGSTEKIASVFGQMFSACLAAAYDPLTVWWTEGSSIFDPCCLIARGLPHPDAFAALLDGSWSRYQWRSIPARVASPGAFDVASLPDSAPVRFRSAASSDVGKIRAINEDAYIEHPDSGLWAVADGIGGHADGEIASRMVCDAFADFLQTGTFDDTIAAACERMQAVNDQLVHAAARSLIGDRPGSTVAALLARGNRCAVVWAGDSRVYRWRSGRLDRLTRDHSEAESALGSVSSHAITRAIGAQPRLELDVCREQVRPGDRFLLCSDGLTRAVRDEQIRACMELSDITSAVRSLIKATLDGGAPDNVTALVVEAYADAVS
jgi:type VI secretion system protein ImpM